MQNLLLATNGDYSRVIDPTNPVGASSGFYWESSFTYSSTIDAISNLRGKYSYDPGFTNQPLLIIAHGWSGDMDDITTTMLRRWAARGFFAVSFGLRGRNSASGSRDASARELHDFYDGITYLKGVFSRISDKIGFVGYSGGGGNGLALCTKFPDLINVCADFFGPSDYGSGLLDGWYYTNPSYASSIASSVGAVPSAAPNEYKSRDSIGAIPYNFSGGFLFMFHDPNDTQVDIVHSSNVAAAFNSISKYNYSYNFGSLYEHGYPYNNPNLIPPESDISSKILSKLVWSIPGSGYLIVRGYIITSRFSIWLGDGVTESENGTNRSAYVTYNTFTDTYNINPLYYSPASQMRVIINQGSKSVNQIITTQQNLIVT